MKSGKNFVYWKKNKNLIIENNQSASIGYNRDDATDFFKCFQSCGEKENHY
jgi:hypothetical protein